MQSQSDRVPAEMRDKALPLPPRLARLYGRLRGAATRHDAYR